MRIFIITMEDPLYTLPFIKSIIKERQKDIVGLAISKGGRLKIGKDRSKIAYLFSLLLIMGVPAYAKNVFRVLSFKARKKISKILPLANNGLESFCHSMAIPVSHIGSPNNKQFLEKLRQLNVDVIINQSQYILKKDLLDIPKIGVVNRHNALLPKNRGRLTPFWVLYKQEKETGVSIHFVDEGMDSGGIIIQERFNVEQKDTFNSIVDKNYKIAAKAMLKALDLLESGNYQLMSNPDSEATVNHVPELKDAWMYRKRRLFGWVK